MSNQLVVSLRQLLSTLFLDPKGNFAYKYATSLYRYIHYLYLPFFRPHKLSSLIHTICIRT